MSTRTLAQSPFLSTFPGRYYYDPAIYEQEQARIFSRMWVYACVAGTLPAAGDYKVVSVAGESVLVVRFEQERNALPEDHPKRAWSTQRLALYRREIERCWRKYEQRNRALAHLASNVLLLLCQVHGCPLLSMESLQTLKSTGRGRGVRGRWRNYCNNSTIRGEIGRLLRYKCHLVGLRLHTEYPRGTSHTCPHCGQPAKTYRSPSDRTEAVKWGRWIYCDACHYHGDRDYCASVNIARLGVAYLMHMNQSGKARSCSMTDPQVKPVSYTGAGAVLLLPPTGSHARPLRSGQICYYSGWLGSAFLQSSQPKVVFLRLCG